MLSAPYSTTSLLLVMRISTTIRMHPRDRHALIRRGRGWRSSIHPSVSTIPVRPHRIHAPLSPRLYTNRIRRGRGGQSVELELDAVDP